MHLPKNNSNGFTLVEVALVLVIIGLLVGVTTTGQQLISGAQASRSVAQMQEVTAAYLTYFDRYRAVPGDDAYAATRWPEAKNGNGDGRISGLHDALPPADAAALLVNGTEGENLNFWWHLRLAGLVGGAASGDGPAAPVTHPLGGRAGIQQDAYGLRGVALCLTNVAGRVASSVDIRGDDGRPDRGAIRAAPVTGGVPPSAYPAGDDEHIVCVSVAGSSAGAAVALVTSGDAGAPAGSGSTPEGTGADAGTGGATDSGGTTADAGGTTGGTGDSGWGGGWYGGGHGGWGGGH